MPDESTGADPSQRVPRPGDADNADLGEDPVFPEPFRALMRRVFGPLNRLNRNRLQRRRGR